MKQTNNNPKKNIGCVPRLAMIFLASILIFSCNKASCQAGMNLGIGVSSNGKFASQISFYQDFNVNEVNIAGVSGGMLWNQQAGQPAYFFLNAFKAINKKGAVSFYPYAGAAYRLVNTSAGKETNYFVWMAGAEIKKGMLFLNVCSIDQRMFFTGGVKFDFSIFNE